MINENEQVKENDADKKTKKDMINAKAKSKATKKLIE
jgi:hypothetical protein